MKKISIHQLRNVLAVAVVGLIVGVAYITNPALFKASNAEAGTGQNVSGWAWSAGAGSGSADPGQGPYTAGSSMGIGWISFNDTSIQGVCDANNNGFIDVLCGGQDNNTTLWVPFGVSVSTANKATGGTGSFSGKAWSDNIGWVSFDSADLTGCPSGTCNAQVNWTTGNVTGWARACAGTVNGDCTGASRTDGWDGWISLSGLATDNSPYGVKISANKFSGYAWGSDVVGWIDFAPTVGGVPVGAQISAPPCTEATATSWGTCQASCVAPPATQSVMGIKIGLCASGGTVTASCGPITQTCTSGSGSGSGSGGPVKLKYKQF